MKWNAYRRALAAAFMLSVAALSASGADDGARVRPAALAGSWYPGERSQLRDGVDSFCAANAPVDLPGRLFAIIAPHAGYRFSGRTAGAAYIQIRQRVFNRVVLLGPSHRGAFRGFSIMDVDAFRSPLGDVPLDRDVCKTLRGHKLHVSNDPLQRLEHSLEIQLPFLQRTVGDFSLVPLMVGSLNSGDAASIAAALKPYLTERTLLVVSSDFTHFGAQFGYTPFEKDIPENIKKLDMGAVDAILKKDAATFAAYIAQTRATICGHNAIAILLNALPAGAHGRLLKYDTSGRMTGSYENSVSYVSLAFAVGGAEDAAQQREQEADRLTDAEKKILLRIARTTLNNFVTSGNRPAEFEKRYAITPRLWRKSGVFVTLKKVGDLRGCIGRIGWPDEVDKLPPLFQGVSLMAVESASKDPRFPAVAANELKLIHIEISALSIARPIAGPEEFQVGKHGIIIQRGWNRAVFLPQVAPEQGWNREQTLQQLCRKAGLSADAWKQPDMKFFVFTAQVFDEELINRDKPVPREMLM